MKESLKSIDILEVLPYNIIKSWVAHRATKSACGDSYCEYIKITNRQQIIVASSIGIKLYEEVLQCIARTEQTSRGIMKQENESFPAFLH